MNCPFCNTEVPQDAVYCHSCGKRIDGKKLCPSCGKEIPTEWTYCVYCGTRTDGKNVCNHCGTAFEGNYCPSCGTAHKTAAQPKVVKEGDYDWRKLLSLLGGIFAMVTVFFSLLFTFFIGCTLRIPSSISGLGFSIDSKFNIFTFLGSEYRDIADTLLTYQKYGNFTATGLYISAVIGTVVSALTLLSVVVLSILAVVQYVRNLLGKTEKTAGALACATFFTFLSGSLLLHALFGLTVSGGALGVSVTVKFVLNGATIAGIVLGATFLFLWMGCTIASDPKLLTRSAIINYTTALGTVVLLIIFVAFAGSAPGGLYGHESGANMSIKYGFLLAMRVVATENPEVVFGGETTTTFVMMTLSAVLTIAIFVVFVLHFSRVAHSFSGKCVPSLAPSIALTALSVLLLAFGIISLNGLNDMAPLNELVSDASLSLTSLIVLCVFSFLQLGASIARVVLKRKYCTE